MTTLRWSLCKSVFIDNDCEAQRTSVTNQMAGKSCDLRLASPILDLCSTTSAVKCWKEITDSSKLKESH